MQVGRTAFILWAVRGTPPARTANFQRMIVWLGAAGVFWVAGGLADPGPRLSLVALGERLMPHRSAPRDGEGEA